MKTRPTGILIIFAAQIMGDGVRFLMGDFFGGSLGLVIVAMLLFYLTQPKVRGFFRETTT
jgi:hypothetical protein